MKRVSHATGSFVTGSAAARALVDFAARVNSDAKSFVVDIAVLDPQGRRATNTLLVGPGAQLEVVDVDDDMYLQTPLDPQTELETFPLPEFPRFDTPIAPEPDEIRHRNARISNEAAEVFDQPDELY